MFTAGGGEGRSKHEHLILTYFRYSQEKDKTYFTTISALNVNDQS